ncbi:MAG: glycerate kinase [Firmicutes bacterium]|nr:glycerate kinase [Bacillota bacterium]
MKFIVIPDKFKGTLTAEEASEIIGGEIKNFMPNATVVKLPVSDGGEGLTDTFLRALKGKKVHVKVNNPFMEEITAYYGIFEDYAVIEVASACGLLLVSGRANTKIATTYGVGEMILHAINSGVKKIFLGLGGTSTTDGGAGLMVALGAKFYDKNHMNFIPTGVSLSDISYVDISGVDIKGVEITCLSDSLNELYGANGASFVYAKQKGATEEDLPILDNALRHFAEVTKTATGKDLSSVKGTGSAGGIGFSVLSFLGGEIKGGIGEVLKIVGFENHLKDADFVITGEGKFDNQSLFGKTVFGIATVAKKAGVPVILLAGAIKDITHKSLVDIGITSAFSINRGSRSDFNDIIKNAKTDLKETVGSVLGLIMK